MDFEPTDDREEFLQHDPQKEDELHKLTSFLSLKWECGPGFAAGFPSFEALGASLRDDSRTPETQKSVSAGKREKFSLESDAERSIVGGTLRAHSRPPGSLGPIPQSGIAPGWAFGISSKRKPRHIV